MTPNEQRIALAEFKGLRWYRTPENDEEVLRVLPDYLNDLNAIHVVEKNLKDHEIKHYASNLWSAMHLSPESAIGIIHATAKQRSEALLKTVGLWK